MVEGGQNIEKKCGALLSNNKNPVIILKMLARNKFKRACFV